MSSKKIENMANSLINHCKKSPVLRGIVSEGTKVMDTINEKCHIDPITLDDFLNNLSQDIDNVILEYAKNENMKPLGGEIFLDIKEKNQYIIIKANLYFQNQNEKIIMKEFHRELPPGTIIPKDYSFIQDNKPKYPIDAPTI